MLEISHEIVIIILKLVAKVYYGQWIINCIYLLNPLEFLLNLTHNMREKI